MKVALVGQFGIEIIGTIVFTGCPPASVIMNFMNLLKLPDCVLGGILTNWLKLVSLVKLDKACCSTASREEYLDLVSSRVFCLEDVPEPHVLQAHGMNWFVARNVKVKELMIDGDFEIDLVVLAAYLRVSRATLKHFWIADVANSPMQTAVLEILSESTRSLHSLNISGCGSIQSGTLEKLLSACTHSLKRLRVDDCSIPTLRESHLPDLHMLHLYQCEVDLDTLRTIISCCPSLRSFQCDNLQGSDACLEALADHCPKLQVLSYENGERNSTASLVRVLQACSGIEVVDISSEKEGGNPSATDTHIAAIMQHCKKLKAFSVAGKDGNTTDASVLEIAARAHDLRHLRLHGYVFASDVPLLALAEHCGDLRTLDLTSRTRTAFQTALTALASNLRSIEELRIADCEISDSVLQAVAVNCPLLRMLRLKNCGGYVDVGIAALAQGCVALQKVRIKQSGKFLPDYARLLWQALRPGVEFLFDDEGIELWDDLHDINRDEVVIW